MVRGSSESTASVMLGRRSGARALLFTLLGEFVLPANGQAWTSAFVRAFDELGVGEKNARQALARVGEQGMIAPTRIGRETRWTLTQRGHRLLATGAQRIYQFGTDHGEWSGEWLWLHCPVPETQRRVRQRLRSRLVFEGFGELAPSIAISPHPDRENGLREILVELDLLDVSVVVRSRSSSLTSDAALVRRAWDVPSLEAAYETFVSEFVGRRPINGIERFVSTIELVHAWRRFALIDPELPSLLLPSCWAGAKARDLFHECRAQWRPDAQAWFAELNSP